MALHWSFRDFADRMRTVEALGYSSANTMKALNLVALKPVTDYDKDTQRAFQAHMAGLEQQLLDNVCAKLTDCGRIFPGEVLLEIPSWDGGKDVYWFPDHRR